MLQLHTQLNFSASAAGWKRLKRIWSRGLCFGNGVDDGNGAVIVGDRVTNATLPSLCSSRLWWVKKDARQSYKINNSYTFAPHLLSYSHKNWNPSKGKFYFFFRCLSANETTWSFGLRFVLHMHIYDMLYFVWNLISTCSCWSRDTALKLATALTECLMQFASAQNSIKKPALGCSSAGGRGRRTCMAAAVDRFARQPRATHAESTKPEQVRAVAVAGAASGAGAHLFAQALCLQSFFLHNGGGQAGRQAGEQKA